MKQELIDLRRDVLDANLELVRRGIVIYTWGNVSAKESSSGLILIKPRGVLYEVMTEEDIAVCNMAGEHIDGRYKPSVDLDIHLAIYRAYPQVMSIAHTHSTFATSYAQAGKAIPCFGTTHADSFYGEIPCTRAQRDDEMGDDYELITGEMIVEKFTELKLDPLEMPGVLVACHGPFTWGKTPADAVENSVVLEEVAKMAAWTQMLGKNTPSISQSLIDKHFLRKHGASAYFYQDQGV